MNYFQNKTKYQPQIVQQSEEQFENYVDSSIQWDTYGNPFKFSLLLKQTVSTSTPIDNTLLWDLQLPQPYFKQRNMTISIRKGKLVFNNWNVTSYPTTISIGIDGLSGRFDKNGNQTNIAAVYTLTELIQNTGTPTTYDITYELFSDVKFLVPFSMTQIKMRLYFDMSSTAISLPLNNNININFELYKSDSVDLKGGHIELIQMI